MMKIYIPTCLNREVYMQTIMVRAQKRKEKEKGEAYLNGEERRKMRM